jgi:hypothetical protein
MMIHATLRATVRSPGHTPHGRGQTLEVTRTRSRIVSLVIMSSIIVPGDIWEAHLSDISLPVELIHDHHLLRSSYMTCTVTPAWPCLPYLQP